jgi:hypothetical protein
VDALSKFEEVRTIVRLYRLIGELLNESKVALAEAVLSPTTEAVTEADRKLQELILLQNELKERLEILDNA